MNKELLSVKELAKVLSVPASWVYDRTRRGPQAIPFIRIGKYIRFDKDTVLRFFADSHPNDGGRYNDRVYETHSDNTRSLPQVQAVHKTHSDSDPAEKDHGETRQDQHAQFGVADRRGHSHKVPGHRSKARAKEPQAQSLNYVRNTDITKRG